MRLGALVPLLALLGPTGALAGVPQAFLVQNSGWMEPFYADPRSPFKALVEAVVEAVAEPNETVTLLAFNQSVPGHESPVVVFTGAPGRALAAALTRIIVARKPNGALADTDFQEAIARTVIGVLNAKAGIIWIFTNNKNSPGNSPETVRHSREFYALLHEEPSIVRTVAFPLAMPVTGRTFRAGGLMVYALAYGADADARLAGLVSGPVRKILTEPPARLKPLDQESVRFLPGEVRNAPSTTVSLAKDGHTVVLDVDVSSRQPTVDFTARIENRFYPYVISAASVAASFTGQGWTDSLRVSPAELTNLEPANAAEVTVALPVPLAEIPSVWSPGALSSMGTQVSIPGAIELSLINQRLEVSNSFRTRLAQIFPGDPLPEAFTPSQSVRSSTVTIPVLIRVNYPVYPLVVVGAGGLVALAAVGTGLALIGGAKRFDVLVDGHPRRMAVKAFGRVEVRAPTGEVVGKITRSLGRPTVSDVLPGHTITVNA